MKVLGLTVCAALLLAPAASIGEEAKPVVADPQKEKPAEPAPQPIEPQTPKVSVPKGSIKYMDARNGFLDMTFGDDIEKHKANLVLVEEGRFKWYHMKEPVERIGNAMLDRVIYGFYKGRLTTVIIKTKGYSNSRALLDVLTANYGRPSRPNRYMEKYYWFGSVVRGSFDQNSITDDATAMFDNIAESTRAEEDEKKAAKSADL